MLALSGLGGCAPMPARYRPAVEPAVRTEASFRSSPDSVDARGDNGCAACGVVRSITQVAGGSVSEDLTSDGSRYDVYRILVQMNGGASYSIDQRDPHDLHKGSTIEVRDNRVYPRD